MENIKNSPTLSKYYIKDDKLEADIPLENIVLYQPFEAEQILLAEYASCLAVRTILNILKIPFELKTCTNAEFMSPGGKMTKLPFMKVGAFVVAEFEPIITFLEQRGVSVYSGMDEDQTYDLRAFLSLVDIVFTNAELYVTFVDKNIYSTVTAVRNGCVFPWPLNLIQNARKRKNVIRLLKVYQWKDMMLSEVIEKVEKCCETLTEKLGDKIYFYGEQPTALDALIFGHLFAILTTKLPNDVLARTIQKFDKLTSFCNEIEKEFYKKN